MELRELSRLSKDYIAEMLTYSLSLYYAVFTNNDVSTQGISNFYVVSDCFYESFMLIIE